MDLGKTQRIVKTPTEEPMEWPQPQETPVQEPVPAVEKEAVPSGA